MANEPEPDLKQAQRYWIVVYVRADGYRRYWNGYDYPTCIDIKNAIPVDKCTLRFIQDIPSERPSDNWTWEFVPVDPPQPQPED